MRLSVFYMRFPMRLVWGVLVALYWPSIALAAPMGFAEAQHLLSRTSFHGSWTTVHHFSQLSRTQAVQILLEQAEQAPLKTPLPSWITEKNPLPERAGLSDEEKKQLREQSVQQGRELRAWWLQEMTETGAPLREKMTLFWHNHFVSSLQKVKNPYWMWQQNTLFRREAVGSFRTLVQSILQDGAMLLYLDALNNRQGQPNENLARELLELFTLGVGHYTEQDIRETARALTGLSIDRLAGQFRFAPRLHDAGEKTIFGQTGRWKSEDVIRLILARPETATFLVTKLWQEFVSPKPDPVMIQKLALILRQNDYQLKPVFMALFTADAFYAPQYRGVLIKSPVELIVGTLKQFELQPQNYLPFALISAQLGQDLFAPPNVRGWVGGQTWINTETLLRRQQWLQRLIRAEEMRPAPTMSKKNMGDLYLDAQTWWQPFATTTQAAQFLLPFSPITSIHTEKSLETVRQIVHDPVYQLK